MRPSLGILVKPPTKKAAKEAVEKIRNLRPNALLLNLPERLEGLVEDLAEGLLGYEEFLEEVEGRVPEPRAAWMKEHEPILRKLSGLSTGRMKVYCYKDESAFREDAERSVRIALLTVRDAVRGEISLEEWMRILRGEVWAEREAVERGAEKVAEISMTHERSICISGFEAKAVKKRVDEEGVESWIRYLGQPYHFPPLDILRRTLKIRGEVDEEYARTLIREHIRFIREYIYYKPFLDAVEWWTREKLYWLPGKKES